MSSLYPEIEAPRSRRRGTLVSLVITAIVLLIAARYFAGLLIEYSWWTELHQTGTWYSLLLYQTGPVAVASVLFFLFFWLTFIAATRHLGNRSRLRTRVVRRLAILLFALIALVAANASINNWTVVRFLGSAESPRQPGEYVDPVFGHPLHFYLFDLPLFASLLRVLLTAALLSFVIYWVAQNIDNLSQRLPARGGTLNFEFERFSFPRLLDSRFLKFVAVVFLVALATHFFLARYDLLLEDRGSYLTGIGWLEDKLVLPLQWLLILGSILAAILILIGRARSALLLLLLLPIRFLLPPLVAAVYLRPNELALERPYISQHIEATRSAFGLTHRTTESTMDARAEVPVDYGPNRGTLDNVRLWDWRAFHDTVSQIQPLRPYVYTDTDIDRYVIDGQLRQVLVAPRELEIRQLGAVQSRWINSHLIYTHGYGLVMAEANRITPDGLPVLFIQDAPPVINTKSLQLTKPEIYFSEEAHEPVFVDTRQQEFNYPQGSQQSIGTTYQGTGGFQLSPLVRLAAAIAYGDPNILITSYLTGNSRMMIHRAIRERLSKLAGFITWDPDPYLVVTAGGRLVWIIDGYTTSDSHPYSRGAELSDGQSVNYIRNSVKATIDAYSGETTLYIFNPSDVVIRAYAELLPQLFKPATAMPADLRAHTRYPETLFTIQAEMYRTFHMRDTESFYNRADLWDIAKTATRQSEGGANTMQPTYVVASLPGESRPEFMLIVPFTPANKHNLIGFMAARCDGEHLGELVFEQLGKQTIVFGPMQIDARINQDQNISKDLTLWGQLGSQVLRGQILVLPINHSFLYVEPIYIQASQTSMPELKKVALAMGNLLSYENTYEQALAQLIKMSGGSGGPAPVQAEQPSAQPTTATPTPVPSGPDYRRTVDEIRTHLNRYRELSSQGKWADAGKELDEIQRLLQH